MLRPDQYALRELSADAELMHRFTGQESDMFKHTLDSAVCFAVLALLSIPPAEAGTFQTLYNFTDGTDGGLPYGGVIADAAGTLYGETFAGGLVKCSDEISYPKTGCGVLYSFTPAGGLKVLVNFTGPNGAYGNNGLTLIGNTLYGSTIYGGASGKGVLFSVHTDGTNFTLLHQFSGTDGRLPGGALVPGPNGVLYGITQNGGAGYPTTDDGVLFEITPSGVYTVLHSFTGGAGGSVPSALNITSTGILVGSTLTGGNAIKNVPAGLGTFFSYVPSTKVFSVLYAMPASNVAGENPYLGSIGPGPTLYAAANDTIFSLDQRNGFVLLDQLTDTTTPAGPDSGPLYVPGQPLIGTLSGGPYDGYGAIYSLVPLSARLPSMAIASIVAQFGSIRPSAS
jgi:uncharacterized repeat protein (TIGR03803 family)